jgi:predicted DNA-binding transcriptional regulator AlpA
MITGNRNHSDNTDDWLDLLTPEDVAKILRKTKKSIYAMLERGLLPPPIRLGRCILFRKYDMVEFLRGKRATSPRGGRQ